MKVLVADADVGRSALSWAAFAVQEDHQTPTMKDVSTARLHVELPPLAKLHDLTLIDCPPADDGTTRAAIMIADLVVLPTAPSPTDFWRLESRWPEAERSMATLDLIREAQRARPELRAVLLLNRMQARTNLSRMARAGLEGLGFSVLKASLGMRTAFAESLALGMTITSHSPGTEAAAEIAALLDELLEEVAHA